MPHPAPRGADWLGIPLAPCVLDYVPLDTAQRSAGHQDARRDVEWPIPLTRVGQPAILPGECRRMVTRRPGRGAALTPLDELLTSAHRDAAETGR